jgi:hypothetical protein
MKTVVEIQSKEDLAEKIKVEYDITMRKLSVQDIIDTLSFEYVIFDPRTGWDTYLVSVGNSAIGYSNGKF